jgi:dUTP pyrophosphatase
LNGNDIDHLSACVLQNLLSKSAELLRPEFIELEPGFKPVPANKGDAGADIKLYYPEEQPEDHLLFSLEKAWYQTRGKGRFFLNGKALRLRDTLAEDLSYTLERIRAKDKLLRCVVLEPSPSNVWPVQTGFKISLPELPKPFLPEYQIRSRSGLSSKKITVANSPGTVDKNYVDEVKVLLRNGSNDTHVFTHGARIAQGVYSVVADQSLFGDECVVKEFTSKEDRGGGFGSTGV